VERAGSVLQESEELDVSPLRSKDFTCFIITYLLISARMADYRDV
jgi:hypothetical protein